MRVKLNPTPARLLELSALDKAKRVSHARSWVACCRKRIADFPRIEAQFEKHKTQGNIAALLESYAQFQTLKDLTYRQLDEHQGTIDSLLMDIR